ncbi:DUF697 domain-containing protein [Desulfuribacillus alkaliarsenatis]|uniref:DUF697 domain-containing protein n=1 Tax=Desulfuribacillus alkaliarsenatis TaxID=766136 RepID=A0A1E5G034_9FIRM|nr:DUF697 domain-containing protein [Desulfuribacillus alkaliarsenatis]OEF95837.1 hypothetical protein BHF68_10595 [Desulfuribacillus alkaliarsenatis]
MFNDLKKLVTIICVVLAVFLAIIWLNQVAQLAGLAANFHPILGQAVLLVLVIGSLMAIIAPLIWFYRMPKSLVPPEAEGTEEYQEYIKLLGERLTTNKILIEHGVVVDSTDKKSIEEALVFLQERADESIKANASQVFIATAISQHGRLDGLIVLLAQMRMIWQVSRIFHQRPSIREMVYLYINVFTTALLVNQVEDIELMEEQIEPVIASVLGSTLVGGSVSNVLAGSNAVATVIINSVLQGSANAYLTLRVGVLTKKYCASVTKVEQQGLRHFAAVEAVGMLKGVVNESTAVVSKAVIRAAKRAGEESYQASKEFVVSTSKNFFGKFFKSKV